MIPKEEFVKLVTQGDAVALFNEMFSPVQEVFSSAAIGAHPLLPQTVTVPIISDLKRIFHVRLPVGLPTQTTLVSHLENLFQELNQIVQSKSWSNRIDAIMFSGVDENVYFVIYGQHVFTIPLGGDDSDREDLATLFEDFILHIQRGHFDGALHLGDLRRKLQASCPTPAGWSFEPGVVKTNLTPDIQTKIQVRQGGQLHFDISYKNSRERGYSDIQSIQNRLSGVLGVVLHKRIGKMSKKVLAANLSAIPTWAQARLLETLNNQKKTLEKNLQLAQKRVLRAQSAINKLDAITAHVEGTS